MYRDKMMEASVLIGPKRQNDGVGGSVLIGP